MANKKRKSKKSQNPEKEERHISAAEKNMFSLAARARDKLGNLVWRP